MAIGERKTLERGRAAYAYQCVEQVVDARAIIVDRNGEPINCLLHWVNKKLSAKEKQLNSYCEFEENPEQKLALYVKMLLELKEISKKSEVVNEENGLKIKIVEVCRKYAQEYKSYTKKIPMLIKNNGLGATLAYINSKAKDNNPYTIIHRQTQKWLEQQGYLLKDGELVEQVIEMESPQYHAVTIETLALFTWMKRFVDGLIEGEAEGDVR